MGSAKKSWSCVFYFLLICFAPIYAGVTGKITGVITEKSTGFPLQGVNITIEGTNISALSDKDGRYTILSISPEKYNIRFSLPDFTEISISDVKVSIDQTVWIDVELDSKKNVDKVYNISSDYNTTKIGLTTDQISITPGDFEKLPVNNIISAIGLQPGIRGGWVSGYFKPENYLFSETHPVARIGIQNDLNIRGMDGENALFLVNGTTFRDPRNNEPLTSIPLSVVKEIFVMRNGFNAEYGMAQSGLVNIITREGNKNSYSGEMKVRYNPPTRKYWKGPGVYDINSPNSYILRPFFDPAVCWTGTYSGAWDYYTQSKYMYFGGWNNLSKNLYYENNS